MAKAARQSTAQVKFVVDGDGKVKAVFNGITGDSEKSAKAIDNLSRELLTLSERVDRAASKSNQLARDRTVLDEALKRGLITQERHNELLKQSANRYDELSAKAKVAGAVIGTALVAGLALMGRETIRAEQQQAQLAAVLKSTGEAAGLTQRQLNAMAADLATRSIFSSGEITEAQVRLLSYTGIIGENIPRAMQIVIDQSARLGISLTQSAETIGRALESPSKAAAALAQQGFGAAFTPAVRESIKALEDAGKEAEAQAVVMGILEESYAGAAGAARDTLGGSLRALKNDFEELLTGDTEGEGVKGVTAAINQLSATMNDPDVKSGFATITGGIFSLSSEILRGIGLLGQYLGKYREIAAIGNGDIAFGDASDRGLQSRLAAVQSTLGNLKQGSVAGNFRAIYGQDSALRDGDIFRRSSTVIADLEAEREQIIREMSRRLREGAAGEQLAGLSVPSSLSLGNILPKPFSLTGFRQPSAAGGAGRSEGDAAASAAAGNRAAAAAARERAQAERELQAEIERVVAAHAEFTTRAEDLAAELEGPLAQAQLAYDRELERFRELAAQGEIGADKLAEAEANLAEQHRRNTEAIQARLDPAADLIKQLDAELQLRRLNNAEARAALDLAHLSVPATREEAEAIVERYRALQAQADAADAMDAFRDSSKRAFLDVATGAEGAQQAIEEFFDRLALRILELLTDRAWEQLFGSQGSVNGGSAGGGIASLFGSLFGAGSGTSTSVANPVTGEIMTSGGGGGGSGMGWIASLFGAIFGGGRASGGDTLPGHFYRVNEDRPELLEWQGQTLLMMGNQRGHVRPMQPAAAGGDIYISIPVTGQVDRRTRSQIGADAASAMQRARSRNG